VITNVFGERFAYVTFDCFREQVVEVHPTTSQYE
jgi:hypothetical protein